MLATMAQFHNAVLTNSCGYEKCGKVNNMTQHCTVCGAFMVIISDETFISRDHINFILIKLASGSAGDWGHSGGPKIDYSSCF